MTPFRADFSSMDTLLRDFVPQCADLTRITFPVVERTGKPALCLTTQPGDVSGLPGSGQMERADVYHCIPGSLEPFTFGEGDEIWVTNSVLFPDEFKAPNWHPYVVFDFHGVGTGVQAPLMLNFRRWPKRDDLPGLMQIQRFYGNPKAPSERHVTLGLPVRNKWYDFLWHIVWSSGAGLCECWLNKTKVTSQKGPTLFDTGERVFMKLANYHLPWEDQPAVPSSVFHDLVRIGPTRASVES